MREKWRLAQVVEIRDEIVRIHFSGWDIKWDEDINLNLERDRIRERKRKSQSLDMSSPATMVMVEARERHSARSCPRCGEHIDPVISSVTTLPVCLPSFSEPLPLSVQTVTLAPLPVAAASPDVPTSAFSRRNSARSTRSYINEPSPIGEDENFNSQSLEDSDEPHYMAELTTALSPIPLSVDDRIHIALKVADRRLSSIRSTHNLLTTFSGLDLSARRGSAGSEGGAVRRGSAGSVGTTTSRSLIGMKSTQAQANQLYG